MKFGLFFAFQVVPGDGVPLDRPYRDMLDCLPRAEELGYESVFVASHHVQPDGWCPSPLLALAAAAARTERMRLGTGALLVPLYAPFKLAEDVAVLDNLSGGRVVLGVAPGYVSEEFEAHGVPREERVARTEETLDLLQAAWTEERTASRRGRSSGLTRRSGTRCPRRGRCAARPSAGACSFRRRAMSWPSSSSTAACTTRRVPTSASSRRSGR